MVATLEWNVVFGRSTADAVHFTGNPRPETKHRQNKTQTKNRLSTQRCDANVLHSSFRLDYQVT